MALVTLTVGAPSGVGYRMAHEDWSRTLEGWDCTHETEGLDPTIYPTEEACQQAIDAL